MHGKLLALLTAVALAPQVQADDCSRVSRQGYHQPPNCSEPKDREIEPPSEGAFVTGPARGEVSGESNSLGLRLGTLRIPEFSIALPTVQLPSLVKFRRNPTMHTDSAEAPFVRGEIAEFGLQPRGIPATTPEVNDRNLDTVPADSCAPDYSPGYRIQPCLPQAPCGEGCTGLFRNGADPWQNSVAHNLDAREQKIARLESQVSQMEKLIELLATQKLSESQPEPAPATSQPPRSQRVSPWSDNEDKVESASVESDSDIVAKQAEQIVQLQSKLEELSKAQASAKLTSSEEDVAEPLIHQETRQAERELPKREKSTAKSGLFSRLGMTLTRR